MRPRRLWYAFEAAEPEQVAFGIDYQYLQWKEDLEQYRAVFMDDGWEHVYGKARGSRQFFRKVIIDENESIFSDVISKAGRYNRLPSVNNTFFILVASIIGYTFPTIRTGREIFIWEIVIGAALVAYLSFDIARFVRIWILKRRVMKNSGL